MTLDEAIKHCEDCISREQAIRATYGFERYTGIDETPYEYVESILRDLPSVTPKGVTITDFADRCRECDVFHTYYDAVEEERKTTKSLSEAHYKVRQRFNIPSAYDEKGQIKDG